ncbi:MAG: putative toxin-antitoxin system toxin component, PIN family [Candidatus Diapherotrites archaeon]|nr:putative toxin-antitoxin system toxin component, PIN family [Candidatus Diapherotrites archaeon]
MEKIIAVVDTNIILSAMIKEEGISRRFLLLPLVDHRLRLVISELIEEEIKKHEVEIARKAGISFPLFRKGLKELLKHLEVIRIRGKTEKDEVVKFVKDKSDAHVVALALVSKADYIVTYNKKDFHIKKLAPKGIKVRTPQELVLDLGYMWVDKFSEEKKRGRRVRKYSSKFGRSR